MSDPNGLANPASTNIDEILRRVKWRAIVQRSIGVAFDVTNIRPLHIKGRIVKGTVDFDNLNSLVHTERPSYMTRYVFTPGAIPSGWRTIAGVCLPWRPGVLERKAYHPGGHATAGEEGILENYPQN